MPASVINVTSDPPKYRREDVQFHDLENPDETFMILFSHNCNLSLDITGTYTKERRLIAAVLYRAILDLIPTKAVEFKNDTRQEAIKWFKGHYGDSATISFIQACEILDLDYRALIKVLEESDYFNDPSRIYCLIGDKTKKGTRRRTRI